MRVKRKILNSKLSASSTINLKISLFLPKIWRVWKVIQKTNLKFGKNMKLSFWSWRSPKVKYRPVNAVTRTYHCQIVPLWCESRQNIFRRWSWQSRAKFNIISFFYQKIYKFKFSNNLEFFLIYFFETLGISLNWKINSAWVRVIKSRSTRVIPQKIVLFLY